MWLSVFPKPFFKKTVLSRLHFSFLLCHKLIDHVCVGLFQDFLFCPVDLCLYANTTLFAYYNLVMEFAECLIHRALFFFLKIAFVLDLQEGESAHESFKSSISVPQSTLGFLDLSLIRFQYRTFRGLISPVQVSRVVDTWCGAWAPDRQWEASGLWDPSWLLVSVLGGVLASSHLFLFFFFKFNLYLFWFSIIVYIQYYSVLVLRVQHSRQLHTVQSGPQT